ncbi:hypothetical protein GCM10009759_62080 [Kitasatospora saccharophila]|uniref:DNA primase/polymerase bifunctional N-terminal domain-containing protein n=1 Tax=Kitasatospora saccharophila TaxID=407973 RepID=A0ABN2XTM7_9ACTN
MHPLAPGGKVPAANCPECRPGGPGGAPHRPQECGCRAAGRWCHGFHAATTDQARIGQWWGGRPGFGVGVACGPAGLVVIDIDAHPGAVPARDRILPGTGIGEAVDLTGLANGFHSLAVLAALSGRPTPVDDASTLRVRTPSGGMHVWYLAGGGRWSCSSGNGGGRGLAWQVDVRAEGGYIVAPGTVTAAGRYHPLPGATEPAVLPDWLARQLRRTGHQPPSGAAPVGPRPVPPRARQAVLAAGGAAPGTARLVAAAVERVAEAVRPGQERRAEQIIRSGLAAGERHPLRPGRRP